MAITSPSSHRNIYIRTDQSNQWKLRTKNWKTKNKTNKKRVEKCIRHSITQSQYELSMRKCFHFVCTRFICFSLWRVCVCLTKRTKKPIEPIDLFDEPTLEMIFINHFSPIQVLSGAQQSKREMVSRSVNNQICDTKTLFRFRIVCSRTSTFSLHFLLSHALTRREILYFPYYLWVYALRLANQTTDAIVIVVYRKWKEFLIRKTKRKSNIKIKLK